jgi:hypothetical protein
MKRANLLIVLGLAIGSVATRSKPAAAEPGVLNARAERLVSEAVAVLEDKCNSQDCAAFAKVAPKLMEAMRIDPKAPVFWAYCKYAGWARSAGDLPAKLWYEAMFMCDAALMTHGDADVRRSASSSAVELREWAYKAGPDDRRAPRLGDPAEAARALFGVGFKVSTEGARVSLAWSDADQKRMQRFIREYYIPVVLNNKLDSDALLDAEEKRTMCLDIAKLVRDERKRTEVTQFCEFQAAREANQQVFMFRGPEPHKVKAGKLFVLQALPDGSVVYEPLLSLAGPRPRDDHEGVTNQSKLLEPILVKGQAHAHYREAAALKLRIGKLVKEKEKNKEKVAARRAAKGPGIYFYDRLAQGWDIPEPVTGHVDDCSKLIAEAVDTGYSEMLVKVDGEACTTKSWALLGEQCRDALLPGAKHKVTAELRRVKYFKTGKKEAVIHQKSIDLRDVHGSKTGKVLTRASITCGE